MALLGIQTALVKREDQALVGFKSSPGNADEQLQFRATGVKSQNFQKSLVPRLFTIKQRKATTICYHVPYPHFLHLVRILFPAGGLLFKMAARNLERVYSVRANL